MPIPDLSDEVMQAHAEYEAGSAELALAMNEVRHGQQRTKAQLDRISALNTRCDELMHLYLDAFKRLHDQSG